MNDINATQPEKKTINPSTPRVKPSMMQIFLTFDSMERLLEVGKPLHSNLLQSCLLFSFTSICNLETLLDLALSGVKGLKQANATQLSFFCVV